MKSSTKNSRSTFTYSQPTVRIRSGDTFVLLFDDHSTLYLDKATIRTVYNYLGKFLKEHEK